LLVKVTDDDSETIQEQFIQNSIQWKKGSILNEKKLQ